MNYKKRLRKAHRLLANRSSLLAEFIEDWPLGKELGDSDRAQPCEEDAHTEDPGMAELADVARETENEIIDLRQRLQFPSEDERGMSDGAVRDVIDSLRQRIGRLNMVAEILGDTGEDTIMDAILTMYQEKIRIERYCQWHRREKGVDPLRAFQQPLPSKYGIPREVNTYEFKPPN